MFKQKKKEEEANFMNQIQLHGWMNKIIEINTYHPNKQTSNKLFSMIISHSRRRHRILIQNHNSDRKRIILFNDSNLTKDYHSSDQTHKGHNFIRSMRSDDETSKNRSEEGR